MADGTDMDHFLVFCHHEVCCGRWLWHGPFSGLFGIVRFSVAYGGDMDHFLVILSP